MKFQSEHLSKVGRWYSFQCLAENFECTKSEKSSNYGHQNFMHRHFTNMLER